MVFQTTITKKGQIVIPKALRDELGITNSQKLIITLEKNRKAIKIEPVSDILSQAGTVKPLKNLTVLQARERFEKEYERT